MEAVLSKRQQGDAMERAACQYLEAKKLSLLTRNYQCRHGEIDLIMWHDDVLVFIEVRYRQQDDYGGALTSVTPHKQAKLVATAKFFLQEREWTDRYYCRFDVIAVEPNADNSALTYDWIQDAFQTN